MSTSLTRGCTPDSSDAPPAKRCPCNAFSAASSKCDATTSCKAKAASSTCPPREANAKFTQWCGTHEGNSHSSRQAVSNQIAIKYMAALLRGTAGSGPALFSARPRCNGNGSLPPTVASGGVAAQAQATSSKSKEKSGSGPKAYKRPPSASDIFVAKPLSPLANCNERSIHSRTWTSLTFAPDCPSVELSPAELLERAEGHGGEMTSSTGSCS
mmetsp:Transcript_101510/g.285148  ORF Transcript_101510/g.285148 Transcript_101510/m.285148 type:complete len:213 (+) Transcript_101510:451-1089(+)